MAPGPFGILAQAAISSFSRHSAAVERPRPWCGRTWWQSWRWSPRARLTDWTSSSPRRGEPELDAQGATAAFNVTVPGSGCRHPGKRPRSPSLPLRRTRSMLRQAPGPGAWKFWNVSEAAQHRRPKPSRTRSRCAGSRVLLWTLPAGRQTHTGGTGSDLAHGDTLHWSHGLWTFTPWAAVVTSGIARSWLPASGRIDSCQHTWQCVPPVRQGVGGQGRDKQP